jgi:hypothetical protein
MRRPRLTGVLFTIGGIALLAWMLGRVGVAEIVAGVRSPGGSAWNRRIGSRSAMPSPPLSAATR